MKNVFFRRQKEQKYQHAPVQTHKHLWRITNILSRHIIDINHSHITIRERLLKNQFVRGNILRVVSIFLFQLTVKARL